jgi:hypothetical protein
MGLTDDVVNGLSSLVIAVVITKLTASDGGSYDVSEVVLSVAIASFLSGFFTSYFAK